MRSDLVALDLETTGLDAQKDAIIEFGAVRLRDGEIVDSYSTLINPGRPIPPEITTLTGIRDEDFLPKPHKPGEEAERPAPSIAQALPAIRAFVGDAVIIGHNISFDLSFLQQQGVFQNNLWIDTYDLAAVLLPRASRYSLSSLSAQLGIELTEAHRALHDARASALLYWSLWQKALTLPANLLREIVNLSQNIEWNARPFFEGAADEKTKHKGDFPPQTTISMPVAPTTAKSDAQSGIPTAHTIRAILGPDGSLAHILPAYENRPQQVEMADKIIHAFENDQHLLVEAGTGIGKSLAYLTSAALWATNHQQPVVISTNTINLQDQLLDNDIPLLSAAVNFPFRTALLKGRGNYLCLRRFNIMRQQQPDDPDELRVAAKLLIWLYEGGSGDKSEINLRGPAEQAVWQHLSADADSCTTHLCEAAMHGMCPFYKARQTAESAHLIIVNHALLLADATSENHVLPDYQCLIVDEAHHFEDATTGSVSKRLDESILRRHLDDLGDPHKGLLRQLLQTLQTQVSEKEIKPFVAFEKNVRAAITAMETHIANLFRSLHTVIYQPANEPPIQLRVTPAVRERKEWEAVKSDWTIVNDFLAVMQDALARLTPALDKLRQYNLRDLDNILSQLDSITRSFSTMQAELDSFVSNPLANTIYWLNLNYNHAVSLHTAPLHIGELVEKYMWQAKKSVVMTSATLRTKDTFDFIQERLGAGQIETLTLDSPFDYRQSTLIFIPNDIPDPNERIKYQQAVERGLIELAAALDGRTLALFTSYTQLQQTVQAIRPRLALGGITVYDQLDTNNRQALLESFKSTEKAVLLGTKSFWEGVDIPGAALSALVIAKLPFPVPNDPIIAARSEMYKDAFNEYTLPDTILRFRQGFGRLIRNQRDRGVVAIFDRRLMSKKYGTSFLEALPDCTIQYGTLDTLGETARRWVAQA